MESIFISHSSVDKSIAREIKTSLEDFGYGVWIDEKDILAGEDFGNIIYEGLEKCKIIIILVSKDSIKSFWVNAELEKAMEYEDLQEKFVIPVRIDDSEVNERISHKTFITIGENIEETVRKIVAAADKYLGIIWSYKETPKFAEESLIHDMISNRNYSSLAIDTGYSFYHSPRLSYLPNDLIKVKIPTWVSEINSDDMINPTKAEMLSAIPSKFGDISEYLIERLHADPSESVEGFYNCKVGIIKIEKPIPRFNVPMILTVIPLTYWIIKEFNRRILREQSDKKLQQLKKINQSLLTQNAPIIDINCPSALYIEVALLTADNRVCIVEKNPNLSVLADSGRSKWTSTLEEGLEWHKDVDVENSCINMKTVIARCLYLELGIKEEFMNEIQLVGIALEYTHLNTGIYGLCSVGLNSGEIENLIAQSEDFQLKCKFIPLQFIEDEYFNHLNDNLKWHPTARLRLLSVINWYKNIRSQN